MKNIKRIYALVISLSLILIGFSCVAVIDITNQCDEIGKATIKGEISAAENNMSSENSVNTQLDTVESNLLNNQAKEVKESDTSQDTQDTQDTSLVSTISKIDFTTSSEKVIPTGNWYHINPGLFTDDELYTVNLIIDKMNQNRYSSFEEERFEVPATVDKNSYYKFISFFVVYFGEWDITRVLFLDVCIGYDSNTGTQKTEIVLYYNKIREFQIILETMLYKIDSILKTFDDNGEDSVLLQISNYLSSNVSYSTNYEDVYDAVIKNKSVCNGFAGAFNMMANRAGIVSDMCIGTAYNGQYHAWNLVTLSNNSQRYYDTTLYRIGRNNKYINAVNNPNREYVINNYLNKMY